jgi:hypothetical protein
MRDFINLPANSANICSSYLYTATSYSSTTLYSTINTGSYNTSYNSTSLYSTINTSSYNSIYNSACLYSAINTIALLPSINHSRACSNHSTSLYSAINTISAINHSATSNNHSTSLYSTINTIPTINQSTSLRRSDNACTLTMCQRSMFEWWILQGHNSSPICHMHVKLSFNKFTICFNIYNNLFPLKLSSPMDRSEM